MKHFIFTTGLWALFLFFPASGQAQLILPQASQKAVFTQTIGLTEITIDYHRPMVKGREIWGNIVPMMEDDQLEDGQIPWRAGANENTIISFSTDVKINGQELKAGEYGLHMIPTQGDWTVIFSNNTSSWGSYFYRAEEDALRIKVTPGETYFHELLTYDLVDQTQNSARLVLRWEKKEIPMDLSINTHEITLASFRDQLRSSPGFSWQGWNTAANYCVTHDINHEEALTWANAAIQRGKNFTTMSTKARLLELMGKENEAGQIMQNALAVATNQEANQYGYELINQGKIEPAIRVFQLNAEKHPNDPNVWDSLGEAYVGRGTKGDKKLAIEALEKALSLNPPASVRENSIRLLRQLEVKKYMDR
jgi:tetratricopeptide (TPR) repeat protein